MLDGPSPATDVPTFAPPRHREEAVPTRGEQGYTWRIEHDVPTGETRAVVGYGGDYPAEDDVPSFLQRYAGTVVVSPVDPGRASAHGEAGFEMRWPEATCGTEVTLDVESDRETYRVRIELTVTEDGEERWRRSWGRTIPRDHQ